MAVELLGVYAPGGQDPGRSRSARLSGGLPETGGLGRSPGGPSETPGGLPEALGASELPETGIGSRSSLGELARPFLGEAADLGNPGSCAHMDPPTPWVSWAAALWAASRNQNLLHPDTAPVARDLEAVAIRWIAPYFGMGGGHLVPGSTVANLTALWAARELRGVTEVVASEAAHVSLRKAANLLGLAYRSVRTDGFDRLDPTSMGDLRSACLVLTAGTTVMGSIDPLDAGQDAAWRHLDAAWAGPLRFSHLHRGLLDGVEAMDSVSVSAHKLMFQPKESAMVLFADVARSHAALSFTASYLSVPNVGLLGSHGATALGLVATLLAWGRAGLAARIERCMDLAVQLDAMVVSDGNLERLAPPATGIVLWRPKRVEAPAVRDQLRATSVSLGLHQGEQWLRCVFANPNGDPALLVDEVRRVIGLGRPAARAS
ncbi:MAG: pyridoxal phosphate-dependent decarboxylase family protein [Acidimicrobiales bacterium]